MNWFDILLLIILAASVIEGVRLGFARVMIGLAALVAGLLLAAWFYGSISPYFEPLIRSKPLAHLAAFFAILIGVQALGALVGLLCAKIFKWTGLGWLDRLLGLAAGALRAAAAAVILVLVFSAFPVKPLEDALAGSRAAPRLLNAAQVMVSLCPRELRDDFEEACERLRKAWKKRLPAARLPADSV
jgi:membrane protein required for colicin V production